MVDAASTDKLHELLPETADKHLTRWAGWNRSSLGLKQKGCAGVAPATGARR
jgi:hypothetical protein